MAQHCNEPQTLSTLLGLHLQNLEATSMRLRAAIWKALSVVRAANELAPFVLSSLAPSDDDKRQRLESLLAVAAEQTEGLLKAHDGLLDQMAERRVFVARVKERGGKSIVAEARDEAEWLLDHVGAPALILLFGAEEFERLGERPLEQLVEVLERMQDVVAEQGFDGAEEFRAALGGALESARLLAEGAKDRDWWDVEGESRAADVEREARPDAAESDGLLKQVR